MFGNQPSPYSSTRSSTRGPVPPTHTGSGRCTGLGHDQMRSKSTNSPWKEASSLRPDLAHGQHALAHDAKRRAGSVPWLRISSRFQPAPMPSSKRPPERWSSEAASWASMIGSRSTISAMPVPTRRRSVVAAIALSDTNGSSVCEYSRGSSSPPGHGLSRLAGMCVCSGTKIASKPASSAARPSVDGRDRLVGDEHRQAELHGLPPGLDLQQAVAGRARGRPAASRARCRSARRPSPAASGARRGSRRRA